MITNPAFKISRFIFITGIVLIFLAPTVHAESSSTKTAIIKNDAGDIVGFTCKGTGSSLAVYDKHGKGKGFIQSGQKNKTIISEPGDRYYLMPDNQPLNAEAKRAE